MDLSVMAIAAALFGYVLYAVYSSPGAGLRSTMPETPAIVAEQPEQAETIAESAPTEETVETASSEQEDVPTPIETLALEIDDSDTPLKLDDEDADTESHHGPGAPGLRNPLTGESGPMPVNYRHAQDWVKDALITEGLLDRTYMNKELHGVTATKVKTAMRKFRKLEKYHA